MTESEASRIARIGAVLASETRAAMLAALLDGRARTVGELARATGVAASTASEHLARALDAGLVATEAAGRHRYYRLAGPEIASMLETIETTPIVVPEPQTPVRLRRLRTCYDHMAGAIAVQIYDQMTRLDLLTTTASGNLELSPRGVAWFEDEGIVLSAGSRRPVVRPCLDWSERRHHLAGAAGESLLRAAADRRWVERRGHARALGLTPTGRRELARALDLDLGT